MSGAGWSHDEAKRHTVVERLYERCSVYAQDMLPCPEQGDDLPPEDWCERCLAAQDLVALAAKVARVSALAERAKREEATSLSRTFDGGTFGAWIDADRILAALGDQP